MMEGQSLGRLVLLWLSLHLVSCLNDTSRLEAVLTEQASKLAQLELVISRQSATMAARDARIEELTATVGRLQTALQTAVPSNASQPSLVAFDVQYKADPQHGLQDNDVMRFDDVILNLGNGYNPVNGAFQAPVAGLYVFLTKITVSPTGQVYAYLLHNGVNIDVVNANDDTHLESGSSTKIVQLQKRDRVWMEKSKGETSVRGWVHTKMSGYLLRAHNQ